MADALLKVLSFVVLVGGLIFVHELGHFVVAKLLGVKVLRFSIGFGPRLFGFRAGETEYRIAVLPLGGYVKMAGDDPTEAPNPEDQGRGFLEQAPWKRLVIAFAGPAFNLLFPVLLYFGLGLAQNGEPTPAAVAATVTPGSPAAQAGLQSGDRILAVAAPGEAAVPVRWFSDLRDLVSPHAGEPLQFDVERGGKRVGPLTIVPASDEDSNPLETTRRGVIGISPSWAPAVVAPVVPGAAGPLQPFDLVVKAGDTPVRHVGDLRSALDAAACRPIDLEVVREVPLPLPGAAPATAETLALKGVPTCRDGAPAIAPADPIVSTYLAGVVPGSPEERAGLRRGDAITAINGHEVHTFRDIGNLSREFKAGVPVALALSDGRTVNVLPEQETYVDELSRKERQRVVVRLIPDRRNLVDPKVLIAGEVPLHRGPAEVGALAWRQLGDVVRMTVLGLVKIATGKISFENMGGPIMLFSIASEAAQEGLGSFLFKMALISVNLGLMNLVPIPVLDGGHIAAALVEGVTRRPLSLRAREIANVVGIALLFFLMLVVFKNDIVRLMG